MSDIAALVANTIDIWTSATQRKSSAGRGVGKRFSHYGVERLRALILDLAVRGKLLPQNPEDEPATALLIKMAAERQGRIKAREIKATKGPTTPSSKPFVLPSGWTWLPLWQTGNIFTGNSIDSSLRSELAANSEGRPFVATKDVGYGLDPIDYDNGLTVALDDKRFNVARPNSVFICAEGGSAGRKIAVSDREIAFGNKLIVNEPWSQIAPRYILYTYLSEFFFKCFSDDMTGIIGGISRAKFLALPFPLPPLPEQRRIVAKVDELMALCDALERKSAGAMAAHQALVDELLATLVNSADAADLTLQWARLERHFDALFITDASIDALKQTILDLAVRGKLVEQNARDEAASELLKRTAKEKANLIRQGLAKRNKLLPGVDHSMLPFSLPSGWAWARFPELGIFERGKSKHRPRNDPKLFSPGIYPLIQTGEVARATGLINEVHSHYSDLGLAQSKLWKEGTLCITIAANIADAAIMGFDACFPDSVVGFVPARPITDPRYFLYFIRTAKADLLRFAPSTAQKNINLGILETLLVPLPPLPEMARIVAKVDALMALCDALKARIADVGGIQRYLADAITERAAA
ncbi:type I restriction enzyme S subunit [Sphingomonas sp. PP-F2F-G114-C0414]|uniref:restriction endonuclease subunit S n=1 Tax=Sphingomonas sp. PP-F2F-G114-C0414 TaxID=2135662 RepID=UPI000EF94459|nr:restriction endonuclease subunit S [Sphingomonas sp. PP-F2F-G114-C0414]RMB39172.1 type I restriction enzyme S subunit [Sphingomonas sp. PP-F2F-G114-C0414]